MERADFLESYKFNWETFDIMSSGASSLDAKSYLAHFKTKDDALNFLRGYGYDVSDPIQNAEMFGNFQEAIQFIKRYFLKEGSQDGLDVSVPNIFYSLTDVSDLLLLATGASEMETTEEESIWASIILKVMHTILHLDKDLRYRYYTTIQTQIFDRFYKFIGREDEELFLKNERFMIPLVDFETKSKKTRESIIIKLLHKRENVAEELFDRIGIRFITHTKIDCLRVMKFLNQNYIIMVNNVKPSRSQNSLINLEQFRVGYFNILKKALKENMPEEELSRKLENLIEDSNSVGAHKDNIHSSKDYKAIHFTCRQLIKYKNPFYQQFNEVRNFAKKNDASNEITKRLLNLDTSSIAKDVRFFYPFEIQITDVESHTKNTEGEASHQEYKRSQVKSAMVRLFDPLIKYRNIEVD